MEDRGLALVAGTPLPAWTAGSSLDVMDANGIQTAITSLSAPGVHLGGGVDQARALARDCNEFAARMALDHPGRFGSFAVLPMPFTEAACAEACYALDTLGADGVVLLGSSDGKFLGDPSLDELMAELNRRGALVFIHPNIHPSSDTLGLDIPGFFVEFLCDTTRASLNLILSGTMEKYQNIRWILAHSGGFLPYIAWRASLANTFLAFQERAPEGILSYIRRFYYETALSPSRYSQVVLKELLDPSHILFGSDFPFAPAPLVAVECQQLDAAGLWTPDELHGMRRGHALRLLPKHDREGEGSGLEPCAHQPSLRDRVARIKARALASIVGRVQNR